MSETEVYKNPLSISFEMPIVRLVSMEPNKEVLRKIDNKFWRSVVSWALATRKRKFVLDSDFSVNVDGFFDSTLNGELTIPAQVDGKNIEFDGASIPLPWLVAALSGNALRPLGSVLIPSIVHDYLFTKGNIEVNGKPQKIDRNTADHLFLEMFRSVSGTRFLPWIAWVAVRAGGIFTRYVGKRGGVTKELIWVTVVLLGLFYLLSKTTLYVFLFLLFGVWLLDLIVGAIAAPYQTR